MVGGDPSDLPRSFFRTRSIDLRFSGAQERRLILAHSCTAAKRPRQLFSAAPAPCPSRARSRLSRSLSPRPNSLVAVPAVDGAMRTFTTTTLQGPRDDSALQVETSCSSRPGCPPESAHSTGGRRCDVQSAATRPATICLYTLAKSTRMFPASRARCRPSTCRSSRRVVERPRNASLAWLALDQAFLCSKMDRFARVPLRALAKGDCGTRIRLPAETQGVSAPISITGRSSPQLLRRE